MSAATSNYHFLFPLPLLPLLFLLPSRFSFSSSLPASHLLNSLFVLLLPILFNSSASQAFFISPPNQQSDCVDLICEQTSADRLGLLDQEFQLISSDGKAVDRCTKCSDCTQSGYSICVQPRRFDLQKLQLLTDEEKCECAHSGPRVKEAQGVAGGVSNETASSAASARDSPKNCRLLASPHGRNREVPKPQLAASEALFRLCYSTALKKLPTPQVENEAGPAPKGMGNAQTVLVTIEEFWLSNYWQALRPRDLRLFYVFPVTSQDHCKEQKLLPSSQDMAWINAGKAPSTSQLIWLCKLYKKVHMPGLEPEPAGENEGEEGENEGKEEDNDDDYLEYQEESLEDEYQDDPNRPPEVQFDRGVFMGAERVRFYFEVKVLRENQLKAGAGKIKFERRETLIKSDVLDFELHPEIYGTGLERNRSVSSVLVGRKGASAEASAKAAAEKGNVVKSEKVFPNVRSFGGGKGTTTAAKTKMTSTETAAFKEISSFTHRDGIEEQEEGRREATTLVPAPAFVSAGSSQKSKGTRNGQEYQTVATAAGMTTQIGNQQQQQQQKLQKQHQQANQIAGQISPSSPENTSPPQNSEQTPPPGTEEGQQQFTDAAASRNGEEKIGKEGREGGEGGEGAEDWLLLRNVLFALLLALGLLVSLAFCYTRSLCCFSSAGGGESSNAAFACNGATQLQHLQQMNGKGRTRIQNGKEYKEAANGGNGCDSNNNKNGSKLNAS